MIVKDDEHGYREKTGGGEGVNNLVDDTSFDHVLFSVAKNSWKKSRDLEKLRHVEKNGSEKDWN